jgi:hypothetical protein
MPQNIDIPWILRDRTGPSIRERSHDKIVEWRKTISAEMGRVIADITFDKSSIAIDDYDPNTPPDKFIQDLAFSTYEPNLRATHLREVREKQAYYTHLSMYHTKRLGSIAMMVPGMSFIGESIGDARLSHSRQRDRRTAYKQRNGTFKSNLRDKYVAHKEQFSEERRVLDEEKSNLS